MHRSARPSRRRRIAAAAAFGVLLPVVLTGQAPAPALTVSGGGIAFTPFQRQEVRVLEVSPEGDVTVRAILDREVGATTAAAVGAALSGWLLPSVGVRGSAMYAPTRLQARASGRGRGDDAWVSWVEADGEFAELDVWLLDATLMLRLPIGGPQVLTYVLLGVGGVRYAARVNGGSLPRGMEGAFGAGPVTRLGAVFGAGALAPLKGDRLALRFELSDQLTRTPVGRSDAQWWPVGEGVIVEVGGGVPGRSGEPRDSRIRVVNHVRLTVGASVSTGAIR
jgi:hypothetical protein